jgi:hypothetical protein
VREPQAISIIVARRFPAAKVDDREILPDDRLAYGPLLATSSCGQAPATAVERLRAMLASRAAAIALARVEARHYERTERPRPDVILLIGTREVTIPSAEFPAALDPAIREVDGLFRAVCGDRYDDPIEAVIGGAAASSQ